jgi:phage RecT family recombinase
MQILACALRGEIGMGLSLILGDYSIIPYENKRDGSVTAQFQLQVNGLKRLCINSRAYAKIDVFEVREGEFKGRDQVTREPIIQWIEDDDKREQIPIVGYYAFYKLNKQYNGFTSSLYWTYDKILRHADRYSKAFDLEIWKAIQNGAESGTDKWGKTWYADRKQEGSPWYGDPTEESHMKMCRKTVLKQLLSDGFAPKSTLIQQAIMADNAEESDGEPVTYADEFDQMAREAALAAARDDAAPSAPASVPEPAPAIDVPGIAAPPAVEAQKRRGRKPAEIGSSGNMGAAPKAGRPSAAPTGEEPLPFPSDEDDPFA